MQQVSKVSWFKMIDSDILY